MDCYYKVLPLGRHDIPNKEGVKVFCPSCHGVYFPRSVKAAAVDSAYFGSTFPNLFLLAFPELIPRRY